MHSPEIPPIPTSPPTPAPPPHAPPVEEEDGVQIPVELPGHPLEPERVDG